MSDFLDRIGDQLTAAHRHSVGDAAASRTERSRPWVQGRRRVALIVFGTLAVAAPAAAVVAPWDPDLERAGVDRPVQTDDAPVARAAADSLAALRREQTADDRRAAAPLIKAIGMGNQVDRVQTAGIRAVAAGWALVPANAVTTGVDKSSSEQLCLTNGGTVGCSAAGDFAKNGIGILSAGPSETSLAGLVPDNVATVRFTSSTGTVVEAPTSNNFFKLSVPETAPSGSVTAPPGYEGPRDGPNTIPGPPMPISGTVQWLDKSGSSVGPADPKL